MEAVLDKPLTLPVRDLRAAEVHEACKELMDEIGTKNHVRVHVVRALPKGKGKTWGWSMRDAVAPARRGDIIHDSITDKALDPSRMTLALLPSLVMYDQLRMLSGKKPIFLDKAMRLTGGELVSVTPNARTTIGADYCCSALGDASGSRAAVAQYIALSSSTGALAATDTTATTGASGTGINWGTAQTSDTAPTSTANAKGEITYAGLSRALATYAHTTSTANYTFTKTFTASAAITAVQACGLVNSATQGQASSLTSALLVENIFTATSLAINDQLTILWTLSV